MWIITIEDILDMIAMCALIAPAITLGTIWYLHKRGKW